MLHDNALYKFNTDTDIDIDSDIMFMVTGQVNRVMPTTTYHRIRTIQPIAKNQSQMLISTVPNSVQISPCGLLGNRVTYKKFYLFI